MRIFKFTKILVLAQHYCLLVLYRRTLVLGEADQLLRVARPPEAARSLELAMVGVQAYTARHVINTHFNPRFLS